jgi:Rps23 Pro-64 3,4-dihydroxylase Tpa1-like proline 4-hydroxylase
MTPLVPELIASLGVTPFDLFQLELELVAHGEGAFYNMHVDTATGEASQGQESERMISGVYYFNAGPGRFSGGALRLHGVSPSSAGQVDFVDVAPDHNTFVAFPSWLPHEVRLVSCESGRFIDSRFALNCWFRRKKPAPRRNRMNFESMPEMLSRAGTG